MFCVLLPSSLMTRQFSVYPAADTRSTYITRRRRRPTTVTRSLWRCYRSTRRSRWVTSWCSWRGRRRLRTCRSVYWLVGAQWYTEIYIDRDNVRYIDRDNVQECLLVSWDTVIHWHIWTGTTCRSVYWLVGTQWYTDIYGQGQRAGVSTG